MVSEISSGHWVIETKFDGERVQIHKDGNKVKLFSRNANGMKAP
jgi:ATP-dependent DNA ligase